MNRAWRTISRVSSMRASVGVQRGQAKEVDIRLSYVVLHRFWRTWAGDEHDEPMTALRQKGR